MNSSIKSDWNTATGDATFQGLQIIAKYFDPEHYQTNIITGAEHDIIFSSSVEKIVEAGITEEDTLKLRNLNWTIQYDSLAHFV